MKGFCMNDEKINKYINRVQVYGFDKNQRNHLQNIAEEQGFKTVSAMLGEHLNRILKKHKHLAASDTALDHPKKDKVVIRENDYLLIKLKKSDLEELKSQTKKLGYRTPTQYAKLIIKNHINNLDIKPISPEQKNILHESNANLERIGRNINQIARQLNAEGYLAKDRLTVDMLVSLNNMIKNHCEKVDQIISINQEVYTDKRGSQ
jgi:hypothetical protein